MNIKIANPILKLLFIVTFAGCLAHAKKAAPSPLAQEFRDCEELEHFFSVSNGEVALGDFNTLKRVSSPLRDTINEEIQREFKRREDGNAFSLRLKEGTKEKFLHELGLKDDKKLFLRHVAPHSNLTTLAQKNVSTLSVDVNTEEGNPALSTLTFQYLKNSEKSSFGLAALSTKNPFAHGFENVLFKEAAPLWTQEQFFADSRFKSEDVKSIEYKKFAKKDVEIYKVTLFFNNGELWRVGYFLKLKEKLYSLVDFYSPEASYFQPLSYLFWGELDKPLRAIVGVGSDGPRHGRFFQIHDDFSVRCQHNRGGYTH